MKKLSPEEDSELKSHSQEIVESEFKPSSEWLQSCALLYIMDLHWDWNILIQFPFLCSKVHWKEFSNLVVISKTQENNTINLKIGFKSLEFLHLTNILIRAGRRQKSFESLLNGIWENFQGLWRPKT